MYMRAVLLCLVCLFFTLLASFFLPSHLSFKNMYMYVHEHVRTGGGTDTGGGTGGSQAAHPGCHSPCHEG